MSFGDWACVGFCGLVSAFVTLLAVAGFVEASQGDPGAIAGGILCSIFAFAFWAITVTAYRILDLYR